MNKQPLVIFGVLYPSIQQACSSIGVKYSTVSTYKRRNNLTIEEALEHFLSSEDVHLRRNTSSRNVWSQEEDDLLCRRYSECGTKIPELLKFRSKGSIKNRAHVLGLASRDAREAVYVRVGTEQLSQHELCTRLGVSTGTMLSLRTDLDLTPQQAADRLLSFSQQNPDGTYKLLSKIFNKSEDEYVHKEGKRWSLRVFCEEHDLDYSRVLRYKNERELTADESLASITSEDFRGRYTQEEDDIIRSNTHLPPSELTLLLPGRSEVSVVRRMSRLKLESNSQGAVKSIPRKNKNIAAAAFAFRSAAGAAYIYIKCRVCQRVMLLSLEESRCFTHEESICRVREIPCFVKLPDSITRRKGNL